MTNPMLMPLAGVVTLGSVEKDIPCRKCGYNLRGLAVDGRCPECGTPVGVSVNGDLLRYSDPAYVDTLRQGVSCILWGILAIIVFTFIGVFMSGTTRGAANPIAKVVILIGYIPSLVGAWWLTSPDPSGIGEDQYGTARKIIRVALLVGIGSDLLQVVVALAKPAPALALALTVCIGLIALVRVAGQFAQLSYLAKLAQRIPDYALSERARFLMWGIGVSNSMVVLFGLVATVIGGVNGTTGRSGPMAGLVCFAGLAGIALLIFEVGYLFMLGRFSTAFREQVALARLTWAKNVEAAEGRTRNAECDMAWSERKKGWVMVGVFGGFLVLAFSGTLMHRRAFRSMTGQVETFNTIDYGGEVFKLSRAYSDYQDYKDDPNNLAPGQEQKLEKAVTGVKLARICETREAMVYGVFEVAFPGYGMRQFGTRADGEGMVLAGYSFEIPRTGKDRVVVYRGKAGSASKPPPGRRARGPGGGPFELIDDFVVADEPGIAEVREEGGELVYCTMDGKVVARRAGHR